MIVPITENRTLPLCRNASGKLQVRTGFENQNDSVVQIFIKDTPFRCGIRPHGRLFPVLCEGAVCQIPKTIRRYGRYLHLTDTDQWCYLDKHDHLVPAYDRRSLFLEKEIFTQSTDGTLLHYGFPMPPSLVSAWENIGIWEDGRHWVEAGIEQGLRKELLNTHRYLMAACHGQLVITVDRRALCMTADRTELLHWSKSCKNAVDLCWNRLANFTLTAEARVYFHVAGHGWKPLCSNAVAISADPDGDDLAVADTEGRVHIYRGHATKKRCTFSEEQTLTFPGKYISELCLNGNVLVIRFSDCTHLIGTYRKE